MGTPSQAWDETRTALGVDGYSPVCIYATRPTRGLGLRRNWSCPWRFTGARVEPVPVAIWEVNMNANTISTMLCVFDGLEEKRHEFKKRSLE
jgi:hypothetical protein